MDEKKTNKELAINFLTELSNLNGFKYPFKSLPKNTGELSVLALLNENNNPMTSGQVALKLHIKTSRVAAILKVLEEKKLIQRTHPEKDMRITLISLTETGHRKCDEGINMLISKVTHAYEVLGEEKMNQFKDTFIELIQISGKDKNTCLD